ncbi:MULTISPECIES: VapB-type antitoxin [Metallosphaera]|uniref:VapB-type antitoxin n=1 Tax=Metallosphaera TaxID=41980 RepID=UPI001F052677|nr:VapB-type antitoxin [Metallosphaera sedula]MCH1771077.1 VapB-type antitoxin [Metallosphaera sedula]MCP6729447.1 VapB-type antitoxin [Metallosphaera sedula]
MKVIKVSDENRQKLLQLAGELQAKEGKKVTLDDVITVLIDHYTKETKKSRPRLTELLEKYQFEAEPVTVEEMEKEIYK